MNERIAQSNVYQIQPSMVKSLIDLGQSAINSGLELTLIDLIKLRVSQINGCAFCQHMHAHEARTHGVKQDRLDVLSAWREVSIFSERERGALAWAEALTLLAGKGVADAEFRQVSIEFSQEEIINLTAAIVAINSWNRIAVGFNFSPKFN